MRLIIRPCLIAFAAVMVGISAHQSVLAQTPEGRSFDERGQKEILAPAAEQRSDRERALLKLLEGQRHIWKSQRFQTMAGKANALKLAKTMFQDAIAIDPTIAEAYTALAEIAVALPPGNIETAIGLASKATEIDDQNFGGHRVLARLFTIKSGINNGKLVKEFADKANQEWREVTRLDPRNAEGWAFRAALEEAGGRSAEQIAALKKWISAASPLDVQFYARLMNGAELSAEAATLKLAGVTASIGDADEAAKILGGILADDPSNSEAAVMFSELVNSVDGPAARSVISSLEEAVAANPANTALLTMLARLQAKVGRQLDAIALLKLHSGLIWSADRPASSSLFIALSDIYFNLDQYADSAAALERALASRNISAASIGVEDREFAYFVFEKLIHILKLANRPADAKQVIERSRRAFGRDDPFSDDQMISLLQSQWKWNEALALVRSLRIKKPGDISLLRSEASILTMLGQVESAVKLINGRNPAAVPASSIPETLNDAPTADLPARDRFADVLFVAKLYVRSGKYAEGVAAANQAVELAVGRERKQIAKVTLASAQHASGDERAADQTLRQLLADMPNSPIALNNLGYFLVERGSQLDEAVDLIKKALRIDPQNPSYIDSLGWAYFKLGKLELAELHLREASRLDIESASIQEHLGTLYLRKGDAALARPHLERALRLTANPTDAERLKKILQK